MCGIVGVWSHDASDRSSARLSQALAAIMHRGPDDEGRYGDSMVALGMRRLAIIDVAGGRQPIANEDGSVVTVFNGEIYNYRALRRELERAGHTFRTDSDTEVLVHGYEQWGDDFVGRLNGMFGFALWDARRRRLLLARDPFGVKPLYWTLAGGALWFASEVKALFAAGIPAEVNRAALDAFLTLRYVPSPHTLFAGIQRLAPGHLLVVGDAGLRTTRYHSVAAPAEARDEREWAALLRERFAAAVARQLMSEVPIGVLLSGGVDSAAVVAMMQRTGAGRVRSYSVGFSDDDISELAHARATAGHYGTEHHECRVDVGDVRDLLPRVVRALEEPLGTTSVLPMYLVCQAARQHVTVALTGQGADEPQGGYRRHLTERYRDVYMMLPARLRGALGALLPRLGGSAERAMRTLATEDPTARFVELFTVFSDGERAALLERPAPDSLSARALLDGWRHEAAARPLLDQLLYVEARTSLADDLLLYGDKLSMAHSLELRVPFLDVDFMAAAEAVPVRLRIRWGQGKWLHRRVVAPFVPSWIRRRPKVGFATPMQRWLREGLADHARELMLGRDSACRMFFDARSLERLHAEHAGGRHDHERQLFLLLMFEVWHRELVRGAGVRDRGLIRSA